MKKLAVLILSIFAMIIPFGSIFASAESEPSINEMRQYLLDLDFPAKYVANMNDEMVKKEYYENFGMKLIFAGTQKVGLSESFDSQPYVIPESDMEYYISTFYAVRYNSAIGRDKLEHVVVHIYFDWLKVPVFQKTDAGIVNWDSNVFTYMADSFVAYSRYYLDENNYLYKDTRRPTVIMQNSLGYDIELGFPEKAYDEHAIKICGVGILSLYPNQPMCIEKNHNVTSINAQYRHNQNLFVGSVGLKMGPISVDFALTAFTNTAATSYNVFYEVL